MRGEPVTKPTGVRPHVPDEDHPVTEVEFALLKQRFDTLHDETVPAMKLELATLTAERQRLMGVVWACTVLSGIMSFIATVATILQAMRS